MHSAETFIHDMAVVDPAAKIGTGTKVGPFCCVGPNVTLGDGVELKSHVVVDGHTSIGDETIVFPFASLGTQPQDLKFSGEVSTLTIGKRNKIREHVTMNPGTVGDNLQTVVGDDGLFMMGSHVAHDCMVGNNVILANNATLAGHVHVGDHAIIGGLSAVHQFVKIGHHAMIGGMSGVENDVIPYGTVMGERAKLAGLNLVGLERRGFDKQQVQALMKAFKYLFVSDENSFAQRSAKIAMDHSDDPLIQDMIQFVEAERKRPLCHVKK